MTFGGAVVAAVRDLFRRQVLVWVLATALMTFWALAGSMAK